MQVFLDSSCIILGFDVPESNAARILDLAFQGTLEVVVSEQVLNEVRAYFRRRRNRQYAFLIETLIRKNAVVLYRSGLREEMEQWKEKVNEKDREQVAAVKKLGLRYLIGYDRDFEGFSEYSTPRQFLLTLGMKPAQTDY